MSHNINISSTKKGLTYIASNYGMLFSINKLYHDKAIADSNLPKTLSRWNKQGWIKRIKRGLYLIVSPEIDSEGQVIEDPWILIPTLFGHNSYVGGWSAAEYWGFTDQIFNSICVFTTQKIRYKALEIGNIKFIQHQCQSRNIFSNDVVWRDNHKIQVSNPAKTIVDILSKPPVGGGIIHSIDCFKNYIKSSHFNKNDIIECAARYNNKTVFKRLGYLSSIFLKKEDEFIKQCHAFISNGYSQLDPSHKSTKLITYWNLFVPRELQLEENDT